MFEDVEKKAESSKIVMSPEAEMAANAEEDAVVDVRLYIFILIFKKI